MRISIGMLCRLAIALVFAIALWFGVGQVLAASGGPCDTDPGTCEDNDDCDQACLEEGGWENGGDCFQPEGCCLCLM